MEEKKKKQPKRNQSKWNVLASTDVEDSGLAERVGLLPAVKSIPEKVKQPSITLQLSWNLFLIQIPTSNTGILKERNPWNSIIKNH